MPDFGDSLPEAEADSLIRKELAKLALLHLRINYSEQLNNKPLLQQMAAKWDANSQADGDGHMAADVKAIYMDILDRQREWLLKKNDEEESWDEDIMRKHFQQLDLEEEKLRFL